MNPPYEQHRPSPRPVVIELREHHFTCDACQLPGVSGSPNAKYHQTAKCKAVQVQKAIARARKRSGK